MKNFSLLTMVLISSGLLFTVCEDDFDLSSDTRKEILIKSKSINQFVGIYTVSVNAKNWQTITAIDRYIDIPINAITQQLVDKGIVAVYLTETDKNIALPFTYYQVRRALFFQPSYQKGHVYINILGNFIINVNALYTFKIIIVDPPGITDLNGLNWQNYNEVKIALKLEN